MLKIEMLKIEMLKIEMLKIEMLKKKHFLELYNIISYIILYDKT
jgi:hypothetical protein